MDAAKLSLPWPIRRHQHPPRAPDKCRPWTSPDNVADWWTRTWAGPVGIAGEAGEDLERRAWRAVLTDGEIFITRTADGEIELVAADAVDTGATFGDEWLPLARTWKVRGRTVQADRILHVANRVGPGERARPPDQWPTALPGQPLPPDDVRQRGTRRHDHRRASPPS